MYFAFGITSLSGVSYVLVFSFLQIMNGPHTERKLSTEIGQTGIDKGLMGHKQGVIRDH